MHAAMALPGNSQTILTHLSLALTATLMTAMTVTPQPKIADAGSDRFPNSVGGPTQSVNVGLRNRPLSQPNRL